MNFVGHSLRGFVQATDKLPTTADLSNCHLELLPENIFINEQLALLNLRHNVLRERPLDEDTYTIGWLDDLHRSALNFSTQISWFFSQSAVGMV